MNTPAEPKAQPPGAAADLVQILSKHRGRSRGITSDALAARLGVPTRRLRKLVAQLRDEGVAVCGTPASGYFVAETEAELSETCAFLQRRAMHSMRTLSRMRRVSMPLLMGQMLLAQL